MQSLPLILMGTVLGIRHAFDTDHVLAISTMVLEHKNPFKAALVGSFWGIGHTTTLFIAGLGILLLRIYIPERLNLFFEFCVGLMLVFLGVRAMLRKEKPHPHRHHKSFLVGAIHGLAGSGVLTILVLTTIKNVWEGIYYILLFGLGSVIGMTAVSLILGLPIIYSQKKLPRLETYIKYITGILSIAFGLFVAFENSGAFF